MERHPIQSKFPDQRKAVTEYERKNKQNENQKSAKNFFRFLNFSFPAQNSYSDRFRHLGHYLTKNDF